MSELDEPVDVVLQDEEVAGFTGAAQAIAFFQAAAARGLRCALVTSGGTAAPLDPVRYLDNFSTGARGAALAEALISRGGYAVLFLHRAGSRTPWLHAAHAALDRAACATAAGCGLDGGVSIAMAASAAARALDARAEAARSGALLELNFFSVGEYLAALAACSRAAAAADSSRAPLIVLAAAVSDFAPARGGAQHKLASASGTLALTLGAVPKRLHAVATIWAPQACIISFKLETDASLLLPKAAAALAAAGVRAVVANLLHRRYAEVHVVMAGAPATSVPAVVAGIRRTTRALTSGELALPSNASGGAPSLTPLPVSVVDLESCDAGGSAAGPATAPAAGSSAAATTFAADVAYETPALDIAIAAEISALHVAQLRELAAPVSSSVPLTASRSITTF